MSGLKPGQSREGKRGQRGEESVNEDLSSTEWAVKVFCNNFMVVVGGNVT